MPHEEVRPWFQAFNELKQLRKLTEDLNRIF